MAKRAANAADQLGRPDNPPEAGSSEHEKVDKTAVPVNASIADDARQDDAGAHDEVSEPDAGADAAEAAEVVSPEGADVAIVVFGLDEGRKPHASAFNAADAELALKAANLMGFRFLKVTSGEQRALAEKLPKGKIFASGRGFVPFVKRSVYERLFELAGPRSEDGDSASAKAGEARRAGRDKPGTPASSLPVNWSEIGPGTLALASIDDRTMWWPVVVVRPKGTGRWVVKWRDFQHEPDIVVTTAELALLHPLSPEGVA